MDVKPSVEEEVSLKIASHREAPRGCLSCPPRRAQGTGGLLGRVAGRRTPRPWHPGRHPGAVVLVAGGVRAGVVPRAPQHLADRPRAGDLAGHLTPATWPRPPACWPPRLLTC